MVHRYAIIGLIVLVFSFTSVHAQDWRNSSLKSKTSNEWRKESYTSKTSDSWRKSQQNSNDSQLQWNKSKWEKSKMNWRNSPTTRNKKSWRNSSTYWRNSQNKWDKKHWRDNPLNWQNSDLTWKNSRKKLARGSANQAIRKWRPQGTQELPNKKGKPKKAPEAEENLKSQIEIIAVDDSISADSSTETTKYPAGQKNSIVVNSGGGVTKIMQGKSITKKFDDGSVVIYGTRAEN